MDQTFIQSSNSFYWKTTCSTTIILALCILESQMNAQEVISSEKSLADHRLLLHHNSRRKNAFEKLDEPLVTSAVRIKGVHCIAASSLRTALVVKDLDNKKNPKLIELETGKVVYDFPELTQGIISAAFSPDGTLLGVTSYESSRRELAFRIWRIGKKVELLSKTMPLKNALWDANGEIFMSNNIKKIVILNYVKDVWLFPEEKKISSAHNSAVAISRTGNKVAFCSVEIEYPTKKRKNVLTVWDTVNGDHPTEERKNVLTVWDTVNGKQVFRFELPNDDRPFFPVKTIAFSNDEKRLAASVTNRPAENSRVLVLSTDNGELLGELNGYETENVVFSPNDRYLISSSKIWDMKTMTMRSRLFSGCSAQFLFANDDSITYTGQKLGLYSFQKSTEFISVQWDLNVATETGKEYEVIGTIDGRMVGLRPPDLDRDPAKELQRLGALVSGRPGDFGVQLNRFKPGFFHADNLEILTKLTGVRGVTLGSGLGDDALKTIKKIKSIRALGLTDANITEAGLKHVGEMSQLENLSIPMDFRFGADGMAHLSKLKPKIISRLYQNSLKPDQALVRPLANMLLDKKFEAPYWINDSGLLTLKGLDLVSLRVGKNISDTGLEVVLNLPDLTELQVFGSDHVTGKAILQISKLKKLKRLDLTGCKRVGDESLRYLENHTSLESLGLKFTGVTDKGFASLSSIKQLRELQFGPNLSDEGLRFLAECKNLESLDLRSTKITDEGLKSVSKMPALKRILLSQTSVSDRGLTYLSKSDSLESIVILNCDISNKGLEALASMKKLTDIVASGSKISDEGLTHFRSPSKIRRLLLKGTSITLEAITEFKKLHPNIPIFVQ